MAFDPPEVPAGLTPHEVIYREGHTSVLRYDAPPEWKGKARPPVLFVYALINKPYIMDLQPGLSVVETLLRGGLDVYLVDWGTPTELDASLTVDDYVNGIVDRCVNAVRKTSGKDQIGVLGYCMGGSFMAMYTALHPEKVARLALLAAGIDFDVDGSFLNVWAKAPGFDPVKIGSTFGMVPPEFFNLAFDNLDPFKNSYQKYRELILHVEDSDFVANFLRMEYWNRDGIPMPGPTYGEFVRNGYQENRLVRGTWELGGRRVQLEKITMPIATITGTQDNIIPAESTNRILDLVRSQEKARFQQESGHIGLSVSRRAHRELWPRVAEWFRKTPAK